MKIVLSRCLLLLAAALLASCQTTVHAENLDSSADASPIVLTSVGPIFSITNALLEGTPVQVLNMPERARSLSAQPTWFSRQAEAFFDVFEQATAVVSMEHVWPQDSLYLTVREHNIHVINIDATLPYSAELTGVSVIKSPSTSEDSPYFWLSPANIIRSAKIISNDLVRLFPDSAQRIRANEQRITTNILTSKNEFESILAITDPVVYALADEFAYMTSEFGIYVQDYFVKQDINWTEEDLHKLTATLKAQSIPVVIHKWLPSEEIQAAIREGGSELVILDTFETSSPDITSLTTDNMKKLIAALPKL